jgi:uncharacterized membrane protein YccC
VVNTLLGGAIALVASQSLWPVREIATYAKQLAGLLRDLGALLDTVTAQGDATSPRWRQSAHEARRRFGVAITNAEATMQRLITEDAPNSHRVEAAMTILTYGRRMASTMTAIAESRASGAAAPVETDVAVVASQLDMLAAALDGDSSLMAISTDIGGANTAPDSELGARSLQSAQRERLRAQLSVMRRAIARYLAA